MSGLWRQRPARRGGRRSLAALACALALAACRAGGGVEDAVDVPDPQPGVDVERIDLALRVDPTAFRLDGRATLTVSHPADLGMLLLGLDAAMEVDGVRVNGEPVQFRHEGNALAIPVSGAASRVEVAYGGTPEAGVYREETGAGGAVLWTDGWPTRAAGWLPAVHHPTDPVALNLTLEAPAAWEIVASGTPAPETTTDGWRRARFTMGEDAPTYTLAWALADFAVTEQAGPVPIRHLTLAQDSAAVDALARTPAILDTLAALFGPLPYGRFATVEVPLVYAGMENAAAPFFQLALYREARSSLEEVVVHEAVHQWWGNDVVPADWRHLWLAEGPATYLTGVLYERLDGQQAFREFMVRTALLGDRDARRRLVPERLDKPENALTATVYQKGAAVLHTLRRSVGDRAFFAALRATLEAYDDQPLATAAFQAELEATSGADLDALFDYWVYGTDIPALRTRWDRDTRTLSWDPPQAPGLDARGLELYLRQDDASGVYVPLAAGRAVLAGDAAPEAFPVGWLAEVE